MRIALAALTLLLLLPPAAHGQSERETIDVLVPADAAIGAMTLQSASASASGWKRVAVSVDVSVEQTVARLQRDLGTEVYLERRYPLLGGEDEPFFADQWGLENTGQADGVPDADIDARKAWSLSTGVGVVVAVVDSGVQSDHPELDTRIWRNPGETTNGADDDGNGFIDDLFGWDFHSGDANPNPDGSNATESHGTFIAGIIAAEVDGEGIAGIAPEARIMNVRACNDGSCRTLDAADAIYYAVDEGADIINLSFGGPVPDNAGDFPLEDAIDYARRRDVLVVTAAGNTPPDELVGQKVIPAEFPHTNNVAVAATNRRDRIDDLFSYYGANIDIAAPGIDILSTPVSGYGWGEGTSFSAPFVAGVAALLVSMDPGVGHQELAARLMAWADRPSGVVGKVQSGRVDAGAVLANRFVDTRAHTFRADADWAAERGVTAGCNPPENTHFCPDDEVTRGQMAAFLTRHLNLPAAGGDFFDDDGGSTFENDIDRLAAAGITKGCNPPHNDEFCPDDPVTREEMAAFLVRALGLTADDHLGFSDVDPSNIFVRDIERLATAGITKGCDPPQNSRFCPGDEVTRGEMAAFLHRSEG